MNKQRIAKYLDPALLAMWHLCRFTGRATAWLLKTLAVVIAAAWREFGKLPHCGSFSEQTAGFFRGIGKGLTIIFFIPWHAGKRVVDKCNSSAVARRWFFLFLLLTSLLYYWFFTPSWPYGAWYACQSGKASWYGGKFYFRRTASGEWFLPGPFYTAAHKTLPLGTIVLVINRKTGQRVVVRINDRGPYVGGRIIDLSYAAACRAGVYKPGTAEVTIYTKKPRHKNARKISIYPFQSTKP